MDQPPPFSSLPPTKSFSNTAPSPHSALLATPQSPGSSSSVPSQTSQPPSPEPLLPPLDPQVVSPPTPTPPPTPAPSPSPAPACSSPARSTFGKTLAASRTHPTYPSFSWPPVDR